MKMLLSRKGLTVIYELIVDKNVSKEESMSPEKIRSVVMSCYVKPKDQEKVLKLIKETHSVDKVLFWEEPEKTSQYLSELSAAYQNSQHKRS